ncbi:hypothetical protein AMTRI_Chr09g41430 [Amborella trichopoda]
MFKNVVNAGLLTDFQVSLHGPTISHLQYTYDTLIFCDPSEEKMQNLSTFVLCCQLALGLKVNFHKTSIVGISYSNSLLDSLVSIWGCRVEKLPLKYLEASISDHELTRATWDPLIHMYKVKLDLWRTKTLSFGGRITLVKSTYAHFPIYLMSILQIPSEAIKLIKKYL